MTRTLRSCLWLASLLLAGGLCSGCAAMAVKPWDRDLLSQPKMRYNPAPMLNAVSDHIYFSKEASTGGMDAAGGGCGCN
jgi:hypothetical protein